jgi:hypothetical protein
MPRGADHPRRAGGGAGWCMPAAMILDDIDHPDAKEVRAKL